MDYSTILISELSKKAETYLMSAEYQESSIQRYRTIWRKLQFYCKKTGNNYYSYDICHSGIYSIYKITEGEKRTSHQTFCIKALRMLDEIYQQAVIKRCHQLPGVQVVECFSEILDMYLKYQESTEILQKTVQCKSIHMIRFLNYLYNQRVTNINLLAVDVILSYIRELRSRYTRNTVSGILFTLRNFLFFLHQNGLTKEPFHQLFPVIFSNKLERLPSYYYEDEIKKILESVDRNTTIGKRDYLILILAVQLGIRAGDIRMMKFDYIHWERNTIEFVQQKTGNPIQLPLMDNIKYSLIEYIRESRPKSESPYLFLRTRAPHESYANNNVFHYVISGYLNKIGVDYSGRKHGLHSMRHSLASNLLKNNTSYPVITGILGHENTNTTRLYLNIDIEGLRSIALEVPYEG